MIHSRILKILIVVLLMHAGVLVLTRLGLIAPRPTVKEPLETQAHITPAAPEPIKQPEPLKQQSARQETPKSVSIVRPVVQPKPMSMSIPTSMLPPSDNAPVVPVAPSAPPALAPGQVLASAPVSSGSISVGINGIQYSEPSLVCPNMSQKIGEEGCAMVKISIGMADEVINVAVTSSSGSPCLDRVAADAARVIKCGPYRQNGRAVSMVASKPFAFKLNN